MPTKDFIRRSLKLTPEEWEHLESLAAQLHTVALRGPTTGQPSWRTLIKEIAQGRIELTRK